MSVYGVFRNNVTRGPILGTKCWTTIGSNCATMEPQITLVRTTINDVCKIAKNPFGKQVSSNSENPFPLSLYRCPKKMYTHKVNIPYYNVYSSFWDTLYIIDEIRRWLHYIVEILHCRDIHSLLKHLFPVLFWCPSPS
jgi:hypothetical protein